MTGTERRQGLAACPYVLAVALLCQGAVLVAADRDWPRFRGPNGSGIGSAQDIPVTWTSSDYLWKIKLPGVGHSSPVACQQRLFVTAGDPRSAQRLILCVEAATGRILWQREYASRPYTQHPDNSYATATPAADARGVVVTWSTPQELRLLALNREGQEMWTCDLGPFVGIYGSGGSPILVDDAVIFNNDQEEPKANPTVYGKTAAEAGKSFIIAVDRMTGKKRWQIDRTSDLCSYATPVVHRGEDGRNQLIIVSKVHGIYAVDAAEGKILWTLPVAFKGRTVASPILVDGQVVVTSAYAMAGVRCVVIRPGSADGKTTPQIVHDITRSVPMVPTPIAKDDRLYLWRDNGIVSCLRLTTGEVVWSERVEGSYYSSPIWIEGRLYCPARNGEMAVIAASDKFEVLARVPLGDKCHATPAVADGVMYLRTASALMALGPKRRL